MHANYLYMMYFAVRETRGKKGVRVLDYGCGSGEVVSMLRRLGVDAYGADVFYEGALDRASAQATGLWASHILEIQQGHLPFKNEFFDLVICNQVFEHIEDLSPALFEIHRVLKSGGHLLSLFPTAEVIREPHISIPFVHWFPKGSILRYLYTFGMRVLGIGSHKENRTLRTWVDQKLDWLDRYVYYRNHRELDTCFRRYFRNKGIERHYIKFRFSAARTFGVAAFAVPLPSDIRHCDFQHKTHLAACSIFPAGGAERLRTEKINSG